ncbi:MAG: hypothetical protein K1X67_01715 [Fimbriimonadaceae bacterium]|nr:hypothetical protein [Fimbriimonadaceae bacterium]
MTASPDLFYAVLAMNVLFAAAAYCVVSKTRLSITLLVIACVAWLPLNSPIEGHVLMTFSKQHGVTSADLLAVAGIVLALVQYMRLRSAPNRGEFNNPTSVGHDDARTDAMRSAHWTDAQTASKTVRYHAGDPRRADRGPTSIEEVRRVEHTLSRGSQPPDRNGQAYLVRGQRPDDRV